MRIKIVGKFTLFILTISFANSFASSNCDQISQKQFEKKVHTLTLNYRNDYQKEENALRKKKIEEKYYQDLREVLCLDQAFSFIGRVWSLDFTSDGKNYILKIGNSNPDLPYPIFYNYRFSENDKLINQLENLSRGSDVKFKFSFIDTISPDSDNYRGTPYPLEPNSDTGNLVYSLYINLHEVTVIENN